jgi:exonuclease III
MCVVNLYAPIGTAKRAECEYFYSTELPQLRKAGLADLVIGGDFNYVTETSDTTGKFHTSRVLSEMMRELHLIDTWTQHPNRPTYTHYSSAGASRIDRIYNMSRGMMHRKAGIEILPAAFNDHNAVVLRLALGEMGARSGLERWKLDPNMLKDAELLTQLRQ